MKLTNLIEVKRKNMPQIKGKDIPELLEALNDNGIAYRHGNIAVNLLKPSQEDVIQSKLDNMTKELTNGKDFSPIIISSDAHVIDGHHRWLAVRQVYGNDARIDAIMIMLSKEEILPT